MFTLTAARRVVAAVSAFAWPVLPLAALAQAAPALDAVAAQPQLAHAIVAGTVIDADSGATLYARNAETLMLAASTTKLVTEGMTLATLGPDFRFRTPVYRTAPIDRSGTVHGDLVLVGSGDPNLSGRIRADGTMAFANEDHSYDGTRDTAAVPGDPLAVLRELSAGVGRAGVRRITGAVVADDSLFAGGYPENGTAAIVSPIVVNDNLVDVTVTPSQTAGRAPTIAVSPQTPYVRFSVAATTVASGRNTIDLSSDQRNADGTHDVRIVGNIAQDGPRLYAYRVPEPAAFARMAFAMTLRDAGVRVDRALDPSALAPLRRAYAPGNLVAEHISPPLSEDVNVTLKVSDNLHADLMPYAWSIYALHAAGDPLPPAFAAERAFLQRAGLDTTQAALTDGLGTDAYFTPRFMVSYLRFAQSQPWFPVMQRALPVLGVDGTLFNIQNGAAAKGHVFAKTGTWSSGDALNGTEVVSAKGLAGITTARSGRHLIFCFYINRLVGPQDEETARAAGQVLGALANAAYETL